MERCNSMNRTTIFESLPTMMMSPRRCNSMNRTTIFESLPTVMMSPRRWSPNVGFCNSPRKSPLQSPNRFKVCSNPESGEHIYARRSYQPLCVAVVKEETKSSKHIGVGTPLEPSSPEGKLLSCILKNQRHLFQFVVSEQLDELASDRDGAAALKNQGSSSIEALLHGRIAEMRENERQIAVEDVMYMSIVHKFSEVSVPMVPKLSRCMSNNTLEIWPSKCRELESIHNLEFQDMIREHVARINRLRGKSSASENGMSTTKIDRLHLGRIYAASIMYGYFLKSASTRRQLDMSLARTQEHYQPFGQETYVTLAMSSPSESENPSQRADIMVAYDTRREKLSSYVRGFDSESLQRCAKIKSKEAVNVIERHTWALFGEDERVELDSDNNVVITFPSLERLVLEAVAFGSFLWEVEGSVDSLYGLNEN